ncbi:hypothetical protein X777_13726 [Ooceraea biroi]|uniref:HTH CENPB-type domain-containing protein n=1 Tax=Ooceraea biroi TaxID=2015173 RepID=A0A026WXN4_OOCBI|nr:hypothetical protein X777_13726 [Ooceraea biroi]
MTNIFYGLDTIQFRKIAFECAEKLNIPHNFKRNKETKLAGSDWLKGFLRRNPRVSIRNPESLSINRIQGFNKQEVNHFFKNLEEVIDKYKFQFHQIFNMDETGISTVQEPNKVFAKENHITMLSIPPHSLHRLQCTSHGLRVARIHRALEFAQSAWLRDYIELNTAFRTRATNDFEKNLYKLMNNAVFGKTMENVRNRVDVKLTEPHSTGRHTWACAFWTSRRRASTSSTTTTWPRCTVTSVGSTPIYVGMCILDISKTRLYEFHYDYMAPLYGDKCRIMYTDTDSLIYRIECEDAYADMRRDIARFDTSDYPAYNAYDMPQRNKKVPGLMKDENNGAVMTEFIELRSKMYALRVCEKKDTKKIKGVCRNVVGRTVTFDDYARCLSESVEMTRQQSRIQSKLHQVYTVAKTKLALSPYDDKRYIVPDRTSTLPWGQYAIPQ